jgi:hypothetical protein
MDGTLLQVSLGSSCSATSFDCKDPVAQKDPTRKPSNCTGVGHCSHVVVFTTIVACLCWRQFIQLHVALHAGTLRRRKV